MFSFMHNERLTQIFFQQEAAQKAELFSNAAPSSAGARQRFANGPSRNLTTSEEVSESPFRSSTPNSMTSLDRESYALRENTSLHHVEARLDDFLAQGREVLDNLVDQRNMLKGTQRRLLDTANTLGLSRDVIGWIERRR